MTRSKQSRGEKLSGTSSCFSVPKLRGEDNELGERNAGKIAVKQAGNQKVVQADLILLYFTDGAFSFQTEGKILHLPEVWNPITKISKVCLYLIISKV